MQRELLSTCVASRMVGTKDTSMKRSQVTFALMILLIGVISKSRL